MERFTISFSNSFMEDRANAFAAKLIKNWVVGKSELYRTIADHLDIDTCDIPYGNTKQTIDIEVELLRDRIREDGANLACVSVPESKPVMVRPVVKVGGDRVKPAKPVKLPKIRVAGNLQLATMRPVKFVRPVKNGVTV